MNDIRKNLQIISVVLNPNEDKYNVKELLEMLKRRIYPQIHNFIEESLVILSHHFQWQEGQLKLEDLERLKQMKFDEFKKKKTRELKQSEPQPFSPHKSEPVIGRLSLELQDCNFLVPPEERWAFDLMMDLEYLHTMVKLESGTISNENGSVSHRTVSQIVPITGLIISRFVRLEKELQTVLETWGEA